MPLSWWNHPLQKIYYDVLYNTYDTETKNIYIKSEGKIEKNEAVSAKEFNEKLSINDEKEVLIVYTCYPVDTPGYKSKRYIVYASLVGDES